MGALLEVKDFHYYYGNIHVVKGINLKVDKGEIVTLIGANGAGKTTTLQSISGLTPAAGVRGEIIYKGTPIQKMHGNKILRMGLSQVLEGRHIFSKLSVYENLMMGAYTRKDKAGIQEDLKRVYNLFPRLEERREQMGGTLSGEHGIGTAKQKWLEKETSRGTIGYSRRLRKAIDPKGLFNPSKLVGV